MIAVNSSNMLDDPRTLLGTNMFFHLDNIWQTVVFPSWFGNKEQ